MDPVRWLFRTFGTEKSWIQTCQHHWCWYSSVPVVPTTTSPTGSESCKTGFIFENKNISMYIMIILPLPVFIFHCTIIFKAISVDMQGTEGKNTQDWTLEPSYNWRAKCVLTVWHHVLLLQLTNIITSAAACWSFNVTVHNQILVKSVLHINYKLQWCQYAHISTAVIWKQPQIEKVSLYSENINIIAVLTKENQHYSLHTAL